MNEQAGLKEYMDHAHSVLEQEEGRIRPDGHGSSYRYSMAAGLLQVYEQIAHKRKKIEIGRINAEKNAIARRLGEVEALLAREEGRCLMASLCLGLVQTIKDPQLSKSKG
jgi:hypothetical protein